MNRQASAKLGAIRRHWRNGFKLAEIASTLRITEDEVREVLAVQATERRRERLAKVLPEYALTPGQIREKARKKALQLNPTASPEVAMNAELRSARNRMMAQPDADALRACGGDLGRYYRLVAANF